MNNFLDFIKKYKILIFTLAVILIISICLIVFLSTKDINTEKELNFSNFEKVAIYNYLENNLLNVKNLYIKDSNSGLNDMEIIQVQIQDIINDYFSTNLNATSIPVDYIKSELNKKYNIDTNLVNFHGLVFSNLVFNPETNELVVDGSAPKADTSLYSKFDNLDNQVLKIDRITQISDNNYKVYGKIYNYEQILSNAEIILKLDNNVLSIETCSLTK